MDNLLPLYREVWLNFVRSLRQQTCRPSFSYST